MVSSSSKVEKGLEMLIQGVDCKAPTLKLSPEVVEALDPASVQSHIPPKVLLIHDILSFYHH